MNTPTLEESYFGSVEGKNVKRYTISFKDKLVISITNYGGIITSLSTPDKNGKMEDIVLGYNSLDGYLEATPYFGAIVGRYGNRISKGQFTLKGKAYQLATNNDVNHLHGGDKGFDKVVWEVEKSEINNGKGIIKLKYVSKAGEEGYPGKLITLVTYTITEEGVEVLYEAETNESTVVNLTQHAYFNLSGDLSTKVLDHSLTIEADSLVPIDSTLIPTGDLMPVANTPFDFTKSKLIGKDIEQDNEQLKVAGGYDHCWALNGGITDEVRKIASAHHAGSGRVLEVFTTEPGVQFYSGNFLDGTIKGKDNIIYQKRSGFCLETQHFPDSPNQPNFPSVVLEPGEKYSTKTTFKFSTK